MQKALASKHADHYARAEVTEQRCQNLVTYTSGYQVAKGAVREGMRCWLGLSFDLQLLVDLLTMTQAGADDLKIPIGMSCIA